MEIMLDKANGLIEKFSDTRNVARADGVIELWTKPIT